MSTRTMSSCVVMLLSAVLSAAAAEGEPVVMEIVEFGGWKRNLKISNETTELIATLDVGPRIVSYRLKDEKPGGNVLKLFADQLGKSGEADWQVRGGHRLWTAPEDLTRTYAPDNSPVELQLDRARNRATITQTDPTFKIEKAIEIRLAPQGSRVTLLHRIRNLDDKPTELAAWALTVMEPGGVEIIPMPAGRPHPGSAAAARAPDDFAPDRNLVLWPYFDFSDPRWSFGSRLLRLRQDSHRGPTKLGLTHRPGWVGYLNRGTLFLKHVPYQPGRIYPDHGCNYETFTNQDMLEMESLSPLVKLDPGAAVEHVEQWELVPDLGTLDSEGLIERILIPRVPADFQKADFTGPRAP